MSGRLLQGVIPRTRIATMLVNASRMIRNAVLAASVLLAAAPLHAQCKPLAGSAQAKPRTKPAQPEFYDEPTFTVSGVTDAANPGGHGSDVVRRTKESLAKDTVALGKESADRSGSAMSKPIGPTPSDNFETNFRHGKELADSGHPPEALPFLERASQLAPPGDLEERAQLHHLMADVEEKTGRPLDAVREYQQAAELVPSEANLFDWGGELLLHRAFGPASEVFTKGKHLFPQSSRMLIGLGVAAYDSGSYDQSAQDLCDASDLDPRNPTPYIFLGKIQGFQEGESRGISDRMKRFVTVDPDNALANYYYAVSFWNQRSGIDDAKTIEAEVHLKKAVRLDPKVAVAYLQLGIIYAERKKPSEAISAYQQAVASDPSLDEAHYRLAQIYRQEGKSAQATEELKLYENLKKENTSRTEREREEIKEFVYTSRTTAMPKTAD